MTSRPLALVALLLLAQPPACDEGGDADGDVDSDVDSDGDGDSDVDVDADADADGDEETDADRDGDVDPDLDPDHEQDEDYDFDESSCEARFWRHWVETSNEGYPDLDRLWRSSFAYLSDEVQELNSSGASVTLGGILSLVVFEGGARVAFYNDRCSENSYVSGDGCSETPLARYSYQLGMGVIHTSNFHPCADVGWTSRMRARLEASMAAHGFVPTAGEVASVRDDLRTICAGLEPTATDYYILAIHSAFGVPTDGAGNDLPNVGRYPFFTPEVSIDLLFGELGADPSALVDDYAAIAAFGGADDRYRERWLQDQILDYYRDFQAESCE